MAEERFSETDIAILVAVQLPGSSDEDTKESIEELGSLAATAGITAAASIIQRRNAFDPSTLLGRGKVEEVAEMARSQRADMVIFDNELSIGQLDRLSSMTDTKVMDRTGLILDIFAMHAHTAEGRTQVELAQLSYLLPRIRGKGTELSRMAGGIGTRRGPGETKLEVDRRRIRRRMRRLELDLDQMEAVRQTQRKQRTRAQVPSVCLVGYTNTGKSSLLNRLTSSDVLVEDQLFSTLDSTTRRIELPDGQSAVISDTVGFIRKLPHELVAAFRSTLEVVRDADLLVHVVDATRQETMEERIASVKEVLCDLGADGIDTITVFNKVDDVEPLSRIILSERFEGAVQVSAVTGEGTDVLLERIGTMVSLVKTVELVVPASRGEILASLYRDGTVISSEVHGDEMFITARLATGRLDRYSEFMAGAGK